MAGAITGNVSGLIETLHYVGKNYERLNPGDIPMPAREVFDNAINQCKVAIDTLRPMRSQSNKQICSQMIPKLAACQENANRLEQLLRSCYKKERLPAYPTYIEAIKGGQERVELVIMTILYEVQRLAELNISKVDAAQMVVLQRAIEVVREGGSSIPKEKTETSQFSYTNYGSGPSGNQSHVGGTSEMYLGSQQTFNQGEKRQPK